MTEEDKSQTRYSSLWKSIREYSFSQKKEEDLDILVQKMFDGEDSYQKKRRVVRRLGRKTGHDKNDLYKARNSVVNILKDERRELLLPIADAIRYVNRTFTEKYDLSDLLSCCAHADFELSDERLSEFALRPLNTKFLGSNGFEAFYDYTEIKTASGITKRFKIYLDTPISIGLMHQGEPKTLVSISSNE